MLVPNATCAPVSRARSSSICAPYIATVLKRQHPRQRTSYILTAQSRSLWWWSRRVHEWPSYTDEYLQARLQRAQKIMRYKYSKALRRRVLWDRDPDPRWAWGMPVHWAKGRWTDAETLSSCSGLNARIQDPEKDDRPLTRPLENQYAEEFARFKAAVDSDPYAAVFGRRLQSPPSSNNSSWTSLSWVFQSYGTRPPVDEEKDSQAKPKNVVSEKSEKTSTVPPTPTSVKSADSNILPSAVTPATEEEYEFDPISMKKVPKRAPEKDDPTPIQPKVDMSASAQSKPFLQSVFGEHGVDIPVRTYKPHKVYGNTCKNASNLQAMKSIASSPMSTGKKGFESSRLRELQSLTAISLGNGVDATNFCDKYATNKGQSDDTPPTTAVNTEDAPLFSGTTYESRSKSILESRGASGKDWLLDEGFRAAREAREASNSNDATAPILNDKSVSSRIAKIEPSLDRVHASRPGSTASKASLPSENNSNEEVDATKANEVRNVSSSIDKLKLKEDQDRKALRQKLEKDFEARKHDADVLPEPLQDRSSSPTQKWQESLSSIWKRVQDQPPYQNLANAIRNMGAFKDSYKQYTRAPILANSATEKLIFKDESLSKTPSIYRKVKRLPNASVNAFTPSKEVLEAEKVGQMRTAALREGSETAKEEEVKRQAQANELVLEIRKAYEGQYGPINVNHRQPGVEVEKTSSSSGDAPATSTVDSAPSVEQQSTETKPLKSLKPIINYLTEEVKATRRVLHESTLQIKALKSRRPPTYWNTLGGDTPFGLKSEIAESISKLYEEETEKQVARPAEYKPVPEIAACTASVVAANQKAAQAQAAQDEKTEQVNQVQAAEKAAVENTPNEIVLIDAMKRNTAAEQRITDAAAGKPNDKSQEKHGTAEAAKSEPTTPVSPSPSLYKVLAYDSSSLQISIATTTSSTTPTTGARDLDAPSQPTEVLSRLNNPAKFLPYFQSLQDQGFEIISGSGDILIFKKVRDAVDKLASEVTSLSPKPSKTAKQTVTPPTESMKAATVLDELATPISPAPAPTAPSSTIPIPSTSSSGTSDVTRALNVAHASTSGKLPEKARQSLEKAMKEIWNRIEASPDTYVMTRQEYRVLNYFQDQFRNRDVARRASERYWQQMTGADKDGIKVRRQEPVFSGQGQTWHQAISTSETSASAPVKDTEHTTGRTGSSKPLGWARFKRGVRRVLLTALATAGIAYAIGAVAETFKRESMIRATYPLGVEGAAGETGRKGRPGIESTENSR